MRRGEPRERRGGGAAGWLAAALLALGLSAPTDGADAQETKVPGPTAAASGRVEGNRLIGHGGPITGVAVAPGGALALTASFDYALGLWDLEARRLRFWLEGHRAAVNAALFLPGGHRALSGGDDFDLILWDLDSGAALKRLTGHQGKIKRLALSPDGALAASASWDRSAGLWSLESGESVGFLTGHHSAVNDVVFSRDGSSLFTASADGEVRRWRLADHALVRIEASHGFGVNVLALDPAGAWLAYGATDGVVRVLDLANGATLAELTGDRRPILALAVSADGAKLAYGDGEGYISVVATADWSLERDFHAAASGPIWALDFVDDAHLLAAGLDDFATIWPITADLEPVLASDAPRRFHLDPKKVSNGERQFARKCSVCHTLTPDTARRAGPSLFDLFGRHAGGLAGYPYSQALAGADLVWTPETLDKLFDLGPDYFTPGSKMPMQRIVAAEDRADLIAYLRAATDPGREESEVAEPGAAKDNQAKP